MARPLLLLAACLALVCARPAVRELRTPEEYEQLLAHHKQSTGLPVVVDFYSDSCGPCRMIAPAFKKIAEEYKDRAVFAKVNMQSNPVGQRLRVQSMPTFHFYLGGKRWNEFAGAGEAQLRQLTAGVVEEAKRANAVLPLRSLVEFYASADPTKSQSDVAKILAKCASLSGGAACAGGAARDLAKKLKAKFGAAPELSSRAAEAAADASAAKAPKEQRAPPAKLNSMSTADLVAELARRGAAGDELAAALGEAAALYNVPEEEEEEDEDAEDEDALPLYRPPRSALLAERVVIVGGGPAGLAAAVYAARAGLAPVVVAPPGGGQLLGKGVTIENYPGVEGETGPGLVRKMQKHAADCGAAFYPYKVTRVHLEGGSPFLLETDSGFNISAHALIVASGADARWLGVAGEHDYKGAGVSSCATCDGFVYRDRDVAVIGGGDTAMEDALVLARTSAHVTVIHRRAAFRASRAMADRVLQHPRITVRWNATVEEFVGGVEEDDEDEDDEDAPPPTPVLRKLLLRDTVTGAASELVVSGAFVAVGHDPNTALFTALDREDSGYLKLSGSKFGTELSVEGVFAAGDVADATYRQAITSAGSGAAAALDAERWLSERGIGEDSADALMAEVRELFAESGGDGVNPYDDADALRNAREL
ncbi:hypothetical protein M885DRAFT_464997 [Pelagophyceae sp. CCMP2097]|nr:hypothetical protein M885DRAFT_464997 [Pelagophyceae sp. CCMP2097]